MAEDLQRHSIDFVVGEEKDIRDILSEAEVAPLLAGMVQAGAGKVVLAGCDGEALWTAGKHDGAGSMTVKFPLYIEGEPTNSILVYGPAERKDHLVPAAGLLKEALQSILNNNLKRMLTTEIHTSVVNQSYEELLETNRKLAASEASYKALAENLEKIVEERTDELKRAQVTLIQKEKLASVGQLAAGMAHEINNPLGFVTSNLNTLKKYAGRFTEMLLSFRTSAASLMPAEHKEPLQQQWKKLKLDMILADIEPLFTQTLEGCKRMQTIVADLKAFSHIDDGEKGVVDLNREIDGVLNVLAYQIPGDSSIVKHYRPLPGFDCNPAQIAHAIMQIVKNALEAKPTGLRLTVDTGVDNGMLVLRFTDNGPGIAADIINRIFDPFFTTKEVGSGIGMGLASAYDIAASYGGDIKVASKPGSGAQFTISLPIAEE